MTRRPLPDRFRGSLDALCPDWPERRFLVAFSGGLDSTALLRLAALFISPGQLAAAHLNHQLRGQAAEADQVFAEKIAAGLGLDCLSEKCDVAALAQSRRKGTEEAARQARYDFLGRAAGTWRADYILTAHQADDQAETMLMNFIKGAGSGGLAGIPPRRSAANGAVILRPLLPFSRAELRSWLTENGQAWVEDLSNEDLRYRRNAVRNEIIPRLKELNPGLTETLGRTAAVLRAEEDFWREHLQALWARAAVEPGRADGPVTLRRA
ncbi:tRNA lysidine(34) synthetase TilS, partial [Deltaproteobacteria bacterium OttesenSCG-928-M10]|nr:tRNA lysidine(34) synthetase TilS [Deltaproteobacteria bacterium OttesenSCG-928-M10]